MFVSSDKDLCYFLYPLVIISTCVISQAWFEMPQVEVNANEEYDCYERDVYLCHKLAGKQLLGEAADSFLKAIRFPIIS